MSDRDEPPPTPGRVTITLSLDEAIVLDAFLSRGEIKHDCFAIEDQAELRVLWNIGATLESELPIVNNPDYDALLSSARERVRDEQVTFPDPDNRGSSAVDPTFLLG